MNAEFEKGSRIEYIDIYRAFGIILMIMGHIRYGSLFDKWIHGFHMPMFFFISGWFFRRKKDTIAQIKKKAKSLLLPYLIFELIQWLILMLFIQEYRTFKTLLYILVDNTYKIPIKHGTYGISPIPGAMWFLTAFFFTEVLYIQFDRLLGNNWKLHIAIIFSVLLGLLISKILPFEMPWALDASFVGMGFFHIARILREKWKGDFFRLKTYQIIIGFIVVSVLIMLAPEVNMRTGNYGWCVPFWINAIGAIIIGWNISQRAEVFLARGKILRIISNWLKSIGKNSIVYLCFNQIVILLITKMLDVIGLNGIVAKIPILVLTMMVLFVFQKLICETSLKVIIGK